MSSAALFRFRQFVLGSLWFYPLIGAILGSLLAQLTEHGGIFAVPPAWHYTPSTASTVLAAIVSAAVALTGFVVTVTVLVIQMATGTFSARYMRIWYRDPMLKVTLASLAGTLTLAFSLLRQVRSTQVPDLGVTLAGALMVVSLIVFLVFFDRFTHRLRPVAVASLVGDVACRTIAAIARTEGPTGSATAVSAAWAADPALAITSDRAGSIQSIDVPGLVAWANKHDQVLTVRAAVGDFVDAGQELIAVLGNGTVPPAACRRLRRMVSLGVERTVEQDIAFAMRIIVDIAVKALSAAINDPTTAVQVIDHLSVVLRRLGSAPVRGTLAYRDNDGTPRLVMASQTWEDYLSLGVTEIREYGATSAQVMRRLRALLEGLDQAVRPEHRAAVQAELARLDATVREGFADSVDKDRAGASDPQGIGGPARRVAPPGQIRGLPGLFSAHGKGSAPGTPGVPPYLLADIAPAAPLGPSDGNRRGGVPPLDTRHALARGERREHREEACQLRFGCEVPFDPAEDAVLPGV